MVLLVSFLNLTIMFQATREAEAKAAIVEARLEAMKVSVQWLVSTSSSKSNGLS